MTTPQFPQQTPPPQGGPAQPPYPPQPYPQPPMPPGGSPAPHTQKNTVGLIALIAAIVGFVFACIHGALIIGWILLPIAFILGIVGLCLSGKSKRTSIAAVIIAIIGTIVGFVVFATAVSDAVDDAFGSDVTVTAPTPDAASPGPAPAAAGQGTRAHPYPLGSAITDRDWTVTVNSVTLNADDAIAAENQFNDAPAAGTQYLMANVTITYAGDDEQGSMPMSTIAYVTADGNTLNSYDASVVEPEPLDTTSTLYPGASTTGNVAFEVPSATAAQGVLAVKAGMFSDKVFVAVQ